MTLPAYSEPFGNQLPTQNDREVADHLRQILAAHRDGNAKLYVTDAGAAGRTEVTLTPGMSRLLLDLLRHISAGDAVTLVPIHEMLTTQQAADLLNVSRPHLIKLLKADEIEYTLTGRHRRIKAHDVFKYRRQRDESRSAALESLFADDADLI
jgi:excisionase family DNA binding protein